MDGLVEISAGVSIGMMIGGLPLATILGGGVYHGREISGFVYDIVTGIRNYNSTQQKA